FLSSIVLPEGMRVLLYRNLQPQFTASELIGARGTGIQPAQLQPLIQQVLHERRDLTRTEVQGAEAETFHALPLEGYDHNLLGVLLIGRSRRELVTLESSLRRIGIFVAAAGILIGLVLSAWATVRVTRPVRRLAETARKVAAGNWGATVENSS